MEDPIFIKDGKWYYHIWGQPFGPYENDEQAVQAYENHIAALASGCPTCED